MNCNDSDAVETFAQPGPLKDRAFIEIPCPTSWDKMTGNDSVRFCNQCSLNVYNITNMTDKEAEAVFAKGTNGERLCARLYRRPDGTIMTDNCPRALRKIRNASRWLKTKIVACFGLLTSLAAPAQADNPNQTKSEAKDEPEFVLKWDEVKAKSKKGGKTEADKTTKGANQVANPGTNTGTNTGRPTMGAIRVPTPAEQAELGKIAAPKKVAPAATPSSPISPNSPNTDKPQVKTPGGEPMTHKMGRIRLEPAKVEPAAKPATSTKDEKAK
jgi:hypothetical protein